MERATGCAQINVLVPNATFEGEEDCLYLNIFRPSVSSVHVYFINLVAAVVFVVVVDSLLLSNNFLNTV